MVKSKSFVLDVSKNKFTVIAEVGFLYIAKIHTLINIKLRLERHSDAKFTDF